MENIVYTPDLSQIVKWLLISGIILVVSVGFAVGFLRAKSNSSNAKFRQLYFLLSGFSALMALTIFCFMLFNWTGIKPIELSPTTITISDQIIPLNTIRSTKLHREGNGVPFQGLGVNNGTNNSLIIELSDGSAKIISEDFYPVLEIAQKIKNRKKQINTGN